MLQSVKRYAEEKMTNRLNNKVALILNAQTMNAECQNALLKSLEEPAKNTFIIIVTDRNKSLLDTIYSRCQIINVPNLNESTLKLLEATKELVQGSLMDALFVNTLSILERVEFLPSNTKAHSSSVSS